MCVTSYTIVASILWRCNWCDVPLCQLGNLISILKPRKVWVGLTSGRAGKGHRLALLDEQRGYSSNYVFRLICPIKRKKKNVCLWLKKISHHHREVQKEPLSETSTLISALCFWTHVQPLTSSFESDTGPCWIDLYMKSPSHHSPSWL